MTWTTRPRSDFGALRGIRIGAGPQVVLLHGVGLRAEAWNAQIDALQNSHEVIALDMAGHGESGPLPGDALLRDYSECVADALDCPAVVVGHSMGAMMALDLAIRHPGKVRGVAALNAICRRSVVAAQAVQARAVALEADRAADPAPTLERWFGGAQTPEAAACAKWLRAADPAAYRAAYRVFAHEDGPDNAALAALHCPALFCTGSQEPNSTPAMSEQMAALAPLGVAEIVAGAAHMMPMTHAREVNVILHRFLRRCGP